MLAEHSLHHVGLRRPSFSLAHAEAWTWLVLAQVHRRWCAMRGHELFRRFEPRRLTVTCADCGWESPGWILDSPKLMPTRREQRGARHAVRLCVASRRAGRGEPAVPVNQRSL
jgi:hypothetical protein